MVNSLLKALFDFEACNPTAKLQATRKRIAEAEITIIIVPPLVHTSNISPETFYLDAYLLSHVIVLGNNCQKDLALPLNLETASPGWFVQLTPGSIITDRGFPMPSREIRVRDVELWCPANSTNASLFDVNKRILLFRTELPLLDGETPLRFGRFRSNTATSMPPSLEVTPTPKPNDEIVRRNPALVYLQNKVDGSKAAQELEYRLSCIKYEVTSGLELATGLLDVVKQANAVLLTRGLSDKNGVHLFAEQILGGHILNTLDSLPDVPNDFGEIQQRLAPLDLGQVDIPELSRNRYVFEHLTRKGAKILNTLATAKTTTEMGSILVEAMECLTGPEAGVVSADALIGLFMITILRAQAAAEVIDRSLFYVQHCSPNGVTPSTGKLGYALLVSESVVIQLRKDVERLALLANANQKLWKTVKSGEVVDDNIETSVLQSRKNGMSVLFLAIASGKGCTSLKSLLTKYRDIYTESFVTDDRDLLGRTLLCAAFDSGDDDVVDVFLQFVSELTFEEQLDYLNTQDSNGKSVAHRLNSSSSILRLGHLVKWWARDKDGKTALYVLAEKVADGTVDPDSFMLAVTKWLHSVPSPSVYDHMSPEGGTILHVLARSGQTTLVDRMLQCPGADINWVDRLGDSALLAAAEASGEKDKSVPTIEKLCSHGADIWHRDLHKRVALDLVAESSDWTFLRQHTAKVVTPSLPAAVRVYSHHGLFCGYEPGDFEKLRSILDKTETLSWVPRFSKQLALPISLGEMKGVSVDNLSMFCVRADLFMRLLMSHATFSSSLVVDKFLAKESWDEEKTPAPAPIQATSALSPQAIDTVVTFFEFSIDQIAPVNQRFDAFLRSMNRVMNAQNALGETQKWLLACMEQYPIAVPIMSITAPELHESFRQHGSPAYVKRLQNCYGCLHENGVSLQAALKLPVDLAGEIRNSERQIEEHREKLRNLGEGKAWFSGLFEAKRAAEIQQEEETLVNLQAKLLALGQRLNETHFALASELGAFNKFHAEELHEAIEGHARAHLRSEKEHLQRLQRSLDKLRSLNISTDCQSESQ